MAKREDSTNPNRPNRDVPIGPIEHDWRHSGRPSTAIVEAVAAVTDREPTKLEPLYRYVDADALDRLVTAESAGGTGVRVSFNYEDVEVTVDSLHGVTVQPAPVEPE